MASGPTPRVEGSSIRSPSLFYMLFSFDPFPTYSVHLFSDMAVWARRYALGLIYVIQLDRGT